MKKRRKEKRARRSTPAEAKRRFGKLKVPRRRHIGKWEQIEDFVERWPSRDEPNDDE
jgi:hypothetical protein